MSSIVFYQRRARRISLTALIDVVFILLMFFMLTSTFTRWQAVDFHSPVLSAEPQNRQQPQVVVLHQQGDLSIPALALRNLPLAQLASRPDALHKEQPIVLVSEAQVTLQQIVSMVEQLQTQGFAVTLGPAKRAAGAGDD